MLRKCKQQAGNREQSTIEREMRAITIRQTCTRMVSIVAMNKGITYSIMIQSILFLLLYTSSARQFPVFAWAYFKLMEHRAVQCSVQYTQYMYDTV